MSDGWWPGKYATAESAEIARLEDALAAERAHADRLAAVMERLLDDGVPDRIGKPMGDALAAHDRMREAP